jgi:hypothetical protein
MTKTATVKSEPTLDERIALALTGDEQLASSFISDLICETETAISTAVETARVNRERAFDPAILDPVARGKIDDATFVAHRLRAGLERLKELHSVALAREKLRDWHQQADLVEERAVKLADELLERYPAVTSWIVDYLHRKSVVDAEIRTVNESAPGYEARRIREIELIARGIEGYGNSVPIEKALKLPALVVGSQSAVPLLWPIQQSIGLQLVSGLFPSNGTIHDDTPVLRFEMIEGVVRRIGLDGQLIEERPMVALEPLYPEKSLREQRLEEQRETAIELERHAADAIAREKGREKLNAETAERAAAFEAEQRRLRSGAA